MSCPAPGGIACDRSRHMGQQALAESAVLQKCPKYNYYGRQSEDNREDNLEDN